MRSYCAKCQTPADFIDLATGECENCIADASQAKLVSRQTVQGATKNAQVRQALTLTRRSADRPANGPPEAE